MSKTTTQQMIDLMGEEKLTKGMSALMQKKQTRIGRKSTFVSSEQILALDRDQQKMRAQSSIDQPSKLIK